MRALALLPLALTAGCVSTVASVVTAPVRVVGKGVDCATTSQSEADRNRGKRIRKAEAQAHKDCRNADGDVAREQCFQDRMKERGYE